MEKWDVTGFSSVRETKESQQRIMSYTLEQQRQWIRAWSYVQHLRLAEDLSFLKLGIGQPAKRNNVTRNLIFISDTLFSFRLPSAASIVGRRAAQVYTHFGGAFTRR